jgi:drug/metabolite transporter (DMT)-like permease
VRIAGSSGSSTRHRSLLVLLILTWAISWPMIKVGVSVVPPLWYACFRYVIAAVCLFALVALRRELVLPPRSDWALIAVSGALQMGAYSALTGLALTVLAPGRASVLAFSTPIWVVPLAAWILNERVCRLALSGVGLGLLGVLAIAAPSLQPNGTDQIVAYAMLIGAAGAWAITIVFVRSHRFTASALALAPWQMGLAAMLLTPVAIVFEGPPSAISASGVASLTYVGPVATAFAYWAAVEAGRHFRASTMSMALLATPSLGIVISALAIGETIGPSLVAGVVLIAAGIRLATLDAPSEPRGFS